MVTVTYPLTLAYRIIPNGGLQPAVEVELGYGPRRARAVAILDSGSTHTLFSNEIAQLLGIEDVTLGDPVRVSTLAGSFEFYIFDISIGLAFNHEHFAGRVGFAAARTPRNILGRDMIFSQFEIGFREKKQQLNFRRDA